MPQTALEGGDVLLCRSKGLVASLIRWGTRSVYSHVAVVASGELQLIIEAIPSGGVRAIHAENFKTEYDVFRIKDGHAFDLAGVTAYLIRMLARKYDFASTIRLGFTMFLRRMRLAKLFFFKATGQKAAADALQENNDYFCSELCYRAFAEGGKLDIVPQIGDAETTSPGDISRSPVLAKIKGDIT